ncbi:MAG: SAM-dependent methyltransferase [Treponema sp.]|nr:SAM-dependent methyltransferase [Treponema sp.]
METALYLIPVTLGSSPWENVIPEHNREIVKNIKHFIVESRKEAVRFLVKFDKEIDIDSLTFMELNEHTDLKDITNYLAPLEKGQSMGIISDAGCPCVADPGSEIVKMAHKKNLKVIPLVGPSSILLSVMASGFSGQSFAFNGYLPAKPNERESKLKSLENRIYKEDQTQLFIEAPYRNQKMFESIIHTLRAESRLCIASGLTTEKEYIKTKSIAEWKKSGFPDIEKTPAIFLLYK